MIVYYYYYILVIIVMFDDSWWLLFSLLLISVILWVFCYWWWWWSSSQPAGGGVCSWPMYAHLPSTWGDRPWPVRLGNPHQLRFRAGEMMGKYGRKLRKPHKWSFDEENHRTQWLIFHCDVWLPEGNGWYMVRIKLKIGLMRNFWNCAFFGAWFACCTCFFKHGIWRGCVLGNLVSKLRMWCVWRHHSCYLSPLSTCQRES